MLCPFIGTTVILGMITGLADLNKRGFFRTLGGQIVHGAVSVACLILVGVAFWRFGWKIGLLDFFLVIIAANAGLTLQSYFRKLSPSLASVKARRRRRA